MNDVDELKQFAVVHARAQNIGGYRTVLDRIASDDPRGGPGSWAGEWQRAGEAQEAAGRLLEACRHYAMARFPYVDGPARQTAGERCVEAFDTWRTQDGRAIERLDIETDGGRIACWTAGLSADRPRPVLLIMGGIVTVKEQWGPVLVQAKRLGMAGIVTEMPGIGENTTPYDDKSRQMIPAVLDAVASRADVDHTYAVALSFSGNMALRCAVHDPRIRGIVTAGAPVDAFFSDRAWRAGLPRVTVDTLAHLTGTPPEHTVERMSGHIIDAASLGALDIPVHSVVSARDEIIPDADIQALRTHVRRLSLLNNDDVHGSPDHVVETRLWTVQSVLRMQRAQAAQRAVIGLLLGAARARRRLAGARS
ncbi:alpha/beta hydrolase [Streptomyces sp. NPDC087845]|uniref:alpha/beta hydrolase n=1 Tax=Streptomyces sp. NPDC087845 TaxID=3365806 RepID=UPI0037FA5E9B